MKLHLVKYGISLILIILLISCKEEVKSDFSWESDEKEQTKPKVTKTTDSDFEFETEIKETKTSQSEINIEPEVKVVNGTLITNLYNSYETDGQLLYLVATKLCWDFDYKKVFGDYRKGKYKNGKELIKIDNCCASFIPSPYISPIEYYYNQYHNDNDINNYQDNVFKLREIRKNMLTENYESFLNLVMSVDPNNLVSYALISSTILNYDFENGQLKINYRINNRQRIGRNYSNVKLASLNKNRYSSSSHTYLIDMTEEDAKAIFEYYNSLNTYNKNPPFNLTTKTTYSLQIPKLEKRPYAFESRIKKIEFYKQGEGTPDDSDKIGSIEFNYNAKQNSNSQ